MNLNSLAKDKWDSSDSSDGSADQLLHATGVHQRLSGAGLATLYNVADELVADQNERLAAGSEPSRIPLLWVSLAETVGLVVDNDGRIIDGPRAIVPGL